MRRFIAVFTLVFVLVALVWGQSADQILKDCQVKGGLAVVVGLDNPALLTGLAREKNLVVQGLDADPDKVAKARDMIKKKGLYGRVSASLFDGENLPYVDNLINVVVGSRMLNVESEEVARILAPRGLLYVSDKAFKIHPTLDTRHSLVRRSPEGEDGSLITQQSSLGNCTIATKPVPDAIDDWTHYLHGADGNAVADDSVVGPPKGLQWVAAPRYARSHEINSSMAAMVSSNGRLFYIWDDGPTGFTEKEFPSRWSLYARDAFNGVLLWKNKVPDWGWREWHAENRWDDKRERAKMLRHLPATLPRRLVASGDRVYVTLGYNAPVSELDAATGKVLREFKGTRLTDEILMSGDALLLRVRTDESPPDNDVWGSLKKRTAAYIMAVDSKSSKILWKSESTEIAPLSFVADENRVVYCNYNQLVCLDAKAGKVLWKTDSFPVGIGPRGMTGTLVIKDDVVLFKPFPTKTKKDPGKLKAFSAKDGSLLWTGPSYHGPGISNPPDLFVAAGLVWGGRQTDAKGPHETELQRSGYNLHTGKVEKEIFVPKLISWGHHWRCYRTKATERFLLLPKRGVEYVDLQGKDHMRNDWLRAPCIYGMLPANGMLYVPPHQCVCYPGILLNGFNGLAPAREGKLPEPKQRLVKGPAFTKIQQEFKNRGKQSEPLPSEWPLYRHDEMRSGTVQTKVFPGASKLWKMNFKGGVTAPVSAGGVVLVAEKEAHAVHALNAGDGKRRWSYTAGGRIDSPPAIYEGLVLFGCSDGCVYCLRLDDGSEVWRFVAAPYVRQAVVRGQLESVWPVHGSVLVQKDKLYFTAGRSSFLDGGIRVYALDPRTGEQLRDNLLYEPPPDVFTDQGTPGYMNGAKSDILVGDGTDIFLFQERMKPDLKRLPVPMEKQGREGGGSRNYPNYPERGSTGKRIMTTQGYLDGDYNEGKYWTYGDRWPGWTRHMGGVRAYCQMMCFNDESIYGVRAFTSVVRVRRGRDDERRGERLFALDHGEKKDRWSKFVKMQVRAMALASDTILVAGAPDVMDMNDPLAAIEGRKGAWLKGFSTEDGAKLFEHKLKSLPVFDGLIASEGKMFVALKDGSLVCFGQ